MKSFDMSFPESVEEACSMLAENPGSRVIAGGTALTVVMKEGVYAPELLINIRGLSDELAFVRKKDDKIHIGALTTLRDIEQSNTVSENLSVVVECLQEIAGVRVRNSATIGGHLAHADVHLDLPPVLAGYGAEVVISDGDEERQLPLEEFLTGYYETELAEAELITEIIVPTPSSCTRGAYVKHRYYSEVDWPCVGVAAFGREDGDELRNVSVLLNSVSHKPVLRLDGVEAAVDGSLTDERIEQVATMAREQVTPSDDLRGSADYKKQMAGIFTKRALHQIRED